MPPRQLHVLRMDVAGHVKLCVSAHMVTVAVGVEDQQRAPGDLLHRRFQIAQAVTGVDQGGALLADDEIGKHALGAADAEIPVPFFDLIIGFHAFSSQ